MDKVFHNLDTVHCRDVGRGGPGNHIWPFTRLQCIKFIPFQPVYEQVHPDVAPKKGGQTGQTIRYIVNVLDTRLESRMKRFGRSS